MKKLSLLLAVAAATTAHADEGMWLYNNFPSAQVKAKHGFEPAKPWLDHVRLSSARLARGCSGSFVSKDGLVMTNHHCAHGCIEKLSTADKDFIKQGFHARTQEEEKACPGMEVNQLSDISDVTARIQKATAGLSGQAFNDAQKGEMSRVEKECATSDAVRCDVVSLYNGGQFHLYKYTRFQDVRLVFAPEFGIAFFGGDPDNFMFPRYDLDLAFVRVYQNGKPAKMDHFLKWSDKGVKEGDLTFVSGHPGKTSRLLTVSDLEYQRDVSQPASLLMLAELRGMLTEFQNRGAEQKRISNGVLFGVENAFKARKGRLDALRDRALMTRKAQEEAALRAGVEKDPAKKATYGAAWDAITAALVKQKGMRKQLNMLEYGGAFMSDSYSQARALVRLAAEVPKPNEQRLREYVDSNLPAVKQGVLSPAPIYPELEIATLTFSLTKMREELGTSDPFVRKVLGAKSPRELATELVQGTGLRDVEARKKLLEGGLAAVDASTDPMVVLARALDGDARAVRKQYETDVESVLKQNYELIAKARFDTLGTSTYPDATFTLRLSYGVVKGYQENNAAVAPITNFGGAFDRATGREPFALPESWVAAKGALKLDTPFNFATTNDIIGGNSGSPVINKDGEVVGLIFDGNIQSLGGEYGFDETVNRAVSVHSAGITQALQTVYKADRILAELHGKPAAAPAKKK